MLSQFKVFIGQLHKALPRKDLEAKLEQLGIKKPDVGLFMVMGCAGLIEKA